MTLSALGIFSAAGAGFESDFELISTQTLGTAVASLTFDVTGLGSTYRHLQLRVTARTTRATAFTLLRYRVNGDTGTNYSNHALYGASGSVISEGEANSTAGNLNSATGTSATASNFGAGVVDFLDAFSTTKNKTSRGLTGVATDIVSINSAAYRNTAAMTSLTIIEVTGANIIAGSRFSLYGIKG